MNINLFDIVDLAIAGVLERHPDKTLDEAVLSRVRSYCCELDAGSVAPFRVDPDADAGTITLVFERKPSEDLALTALWDSVLEKCETHMDGGCTISFCFEGIFR